MAPRHHHLVPGSSGRAVLLGPSTTLPVTGGAVLRGSPRPVVLVDGDDPPRRRYGDVGFIGSTVEGG
jgi:thiamine phosphate synthase YjbQ (UPF0047 family)